MPGKNNSRADFKVQSRLLIQKANTLLLLSFILALWQAGQAWGAYADLLKKNNPDPIVLLDQDWQVRIDDNQNTQTVSLPYFVQEQVEQLSFSKKFLIADTLRNYNLRICFLGLNGVATIKINSKSIRKHLNLLSSFFVDIPADLLQPGAENILEIVLVPAAEYEQSIPQVVQVFRAPSWLGILREIYLEFIPPLSVSNFKYAFTADRLNYSYTVSFPKTDRSEPGTNPQIKIQERLLTPDMAGITLGTADLIISEDQKNVEHEFLLLNPVNWTPRTPGIYWLELVLSMSGQQEKIYRFPVYRRQIQIVSGSIQVEGAPFLMKGISYREMYSDARGRPLKFDEFYRKLQVDLRTIKQLGFNTIRFPAEPPHPYCAYLADSLGLFILVENGIWRLPAANLIQDYLIQASWALADEILLTFQQHPCFLALGIGQEIPVHLPEARKYLTYLTDYLDQRNKILRYIAPLDYTQLPSTDTRVDFYLIDKYDQGIFALLNSAPVFNRLITGNKPVILGTVGFRAPLPADQDFQRQNEYQISRAQRFFKLFQPYADKSGFIWDSYQDWWAAVPVSIGRKVTESGWIYPYGLLTYTGEKRDLYQKLPAFMNFDFSEIFEDPKDSRSSNFFSISTFICSLIFLLFYQRNYRFKENIKRSLAHPYGFFVDLRDRRIISILNSTVIGIFSNLMVAILLAALAFYYRDNLLFEEVATVITVPLGAKEIYLTILQSPLRIMLFILCCLYLAQYMVALLLRFLNFFTETKARFRQLVAMCNWAGAPLILLLPLSMFSLHLLPIASVPAIIYYVLIIFFCWYNFRLGSGIRVFFLIRTYKVLLILVLIYAIPVCIFLFLNGNNYELIDYLSLLREAGNLF